MEYTTHYPNTTLQFELEEGLHSKSVTLKLFYGAKCFSLCQGYTLSTICQAYNGFHIYLVPYGSFNKRSTYIMFLVRFYIFVDKINLSIFLEKLFSRFCCIEENRRFYSYQS